MNVQEIKFRTDPRIPIIDNLPLTLTSNTGSVTGKIDIGDLGVWINNLQITAHDSNGIPLHESWSTARDKIKILMSDNNNTQFTTNPVDIFTFNNWYKNPNHFGWVFRAKTKISFQISAPGFPGTAKSTYPILFEIILGGYKLLSEVTQPDLPELRR